MLRLTWVLAASLLVACGGSSNGDLTSGGGGSHTDASAGSGGSAASGTGGGTSSGGAAGSGATGGATTGGSGGIAGTSSGGSATGGSGGTATGGAGGSGGQPVAGSVTCGLKACTISSQSCCFGDNVTPYCYPKGQLLGCKCTGILCEKAVVNCDGPEDCPNALCCATKGVTGQHFDRLSCATTCQNSIGVTAAVVCHLNTSGECDGGQSCVTDPRLPGGYGLCGP